jgi:hypothetical protein
MHDPRLLRSVNLLRGIFLCVLVLYGSCAQAEKPKAAAQKPTFEKDVLPIFKSRCLSCHSGKTPKAGLDLSTHQSVLVGSDSGAVVRQSAAESSLLWEKIAGAKMPPKGPKLTAKQRGIIRVWINEGAKGNTTAGAANRTKSGVSDFSISDDDRDFWAFKTPRKKQPPKVAGQHRVVNVIDAFVLEKLEASKLTLSKSAAQRVLIRRAYFDLLGVPPNPATLRQFLADENPDAYERLIDDLLSNPGYGERWGRHWLDVAGYADSAGILNEDRVLPLAYRYRDYVIQALNKNKPYDRFIQEQIAGDELVEYWTHFENDAALSEEIIEAITATGYLRCAPDPSRPDFKTIKTAASEYFYPTINDTMQIVSTSLMGMTLQCARCHDHMFDPIPQEDFYRVQAVFMGAYRPTSWTPQMNRRLTTLSKSQLDLAKKTNQEVEQNTKKLNTELAKLRTDFKSKRLTDQIQKLPEGEREAVRNALETAANKRNEAQKALAKKHAALIPDDKKVDEILTQEYAEYKTSKSKLTQQIAAEARRRITISEVRALYDLPGEVPTPFLRRGDALTPAHHVQPGSISILAEQAKFKWAKPQPETRTSGRRLAFAKWLCDPQHPLTARVMVNRIWRHHFGEGIVATPDNFGRAGELPSHPELLDWLAVEFIESGWDVKYMHRLIMTSSTYRQASTISSSDQRAIEVDPENNLLWRQRLRRLEAESIRDAVLSVAGRLQSSMLGSPSGVHVMPDGEIVVHQNSNPNRRSIYLQNLRLKPITMLNAFDQPMMQINCHVRSQSTVSTQALTLLNSSFMIDAANAFSQRILDGSLGDPARQAIEIAFGRIASKQELESLNAFLDSQQRRYQETDKKITDRSAQQMALADLCHMLLSANEFIYID